MTNESFNELKQLLKDYPDRDEAKRIIAFIKKKNRCVGCHNNDGLPHSECYDCEPYNEI